jgi:serine/threonine-protein kinase
VISFRWSGIGDPHENGEKALPLLDQALARDPQFALAHYLASRIHGELFWFGYDKSWERLAKSKAAAEAALRLQPEMGEGHLALAFYHYYSSRDYEAAIRELTLAQRSLPNESDVASALGVIERRRGAGRKRFSTWSARGNSIHGIFLRSGIFPKR